MKTAASEIRNPNRLVVLDGLRGIAAALVVVHHTFAWRYGPSPLPRAYIAVDFFFMLSGFVLARTYEDRMQTGLGPWRFLKLRWKRLWPTMAVGILLGAITLGWESPRGWRFYASVVRELLFIPKLWGTEIGVFTFDGVEWSMVAELFVNVVHAAFLKRLNNKWLIVFTAITAVMLILTAWYA